MFVNRRFYILILLGFIYSHSGSAANAILKRKDTGTDICAPKKCLNLKPFTDRSGEVSGYETSFEIMIRLDATDIGCTFPWTIKAQDANGQIVASSVEIFETDFWEIRNSNNLGAADVSLKITHKDIQNSPTLGCFRSTCNEPYTLIGLTFKIFNESGELTLSCPYFQHNDLIQGSNSFSEEISLCLCIDKGSSVAIGGEEIGDKPQINDRPETDTQNRTGKGDHQFVNSKRMIQLPKSSVINLYPNPTTDKVFLTISSYAETKDLVVLWEILDFTGKKIKTGVHHNLETKEILAHGEVTAGTYFIKLQLDDLVTIKKLVIY